MVGELLSRQLIIRRSRPAFLCASWHLIFRFLFLLFFIHKTFLILSVLAREHFLWDRKGEENPLVNIISTEQPVFKDHDKKGKQVLCHRPSITLYVSLSIIPIDILDRLVQVKEAICFQKLSIGCLQPFVPDGFFSVSFHFFLFLSFLFGGI